MSDFALPGFGRNRPKGAVKKAKKQQPVAHKNSVSSLKLRKWIRNLFVLAVILLLGYQAVISAFHIFMDVNSKQVEKLVINENLGRIKKAEIEESLSTFLIEPLVSLDMEGMKIILEENPWVRNATLERVWPATIKVFIEEETPIARWRESDLLNQDAEIFSPPSIAGLDDLPVLSGPKSRETEVMDQYREFSSLLYPLGLRIAKLMLNDRGAWTIELKNGVKIIVGSDRMAEKMFRLSGFLKKGVIEQMVEIESIDLRYTNGIAIKQKNVDTEAMVSL